MPDNKFEGIFIADLHCSKKRRNECLEVLQKVWNYVYESEKKPPVFICGDFWDAAITATEQSGYSEFIESVHDIQKLTQVYMIYGTPLHEPEGSLKQFELMKCVVFDKFTFVDCGNFELIALPEPRVSHYSSNLDKNSFDKKRESAVDLINKDMAEFFNSIPAKTEKPRIVIGHGEIFGSNLDNGMEATGELSFKPGLLKGLNADFYGFGHIHTTQEIFENCWYIGSAFQKSYGESHDPSMFVVEVN